MDDYAGISPQSAGYSPAADSQQAYVDMGQGTVPRPTQFGMTDKQKALAAQMLQNAFKQQPTAPTFSQSTRPASPIPGSYSQGSGFVNTGGQ